MSEFIYLVPKGQPSPGAVWLELSARRVHVERETEREWVGYPDGVSLDSPLTYPKFAWTKIEFPNRPAAMRLESDMEVPDDW